MESSLVYDKNSKFLVSFAFGRADILGITEDAVNEARRVNGFHSASFCAPFLRPQSARYLGKHFGHLPRT